MRNQTYLYLFLALMMVSGLNAQVDNKPNGSNIPTATATLPTNLAYVTGDIVNYVRTYDFYKELTDITNLSTEIGNNNVMQATQYFDGLGRPIQTVARRASGNNKDLISFMMYDRYGRQVYQPMTYAAGTDNGAMQVKPSEDMIQDLGGHYAGETYFYGRTSFEDSPLNRVSEQMAPGNSWAGTGNGVVSEVNTNTSGEGVKKWNLSVSPPTATDYAVGELIKTVITDENDHKVKEYTNKSGQVVLKQVQRGSSTAEAHGNWLSTYYLYDDYGNLRYVAPPRAVDILSANSWNWNLIPDLIFEYSYDDKNRMITKKVPGAGEVHMVYDKLDRLVLSQDANQDADNQWTFTKYDALNRPVLTGFINDSADRAAMQNQVDTWLGEIHVRTEGLSTANVLEGVTITTSNRDTSIDTYRTTTTGYIEFLSGFESETNADFQTQTTLDLSYNYVHYEGYHDATFPKLVNYVGQFEMNTVNFYDNYDFTSKSWSTDYNGFYTTTQQELDYNFVTPVQYSNVKGLATGSKVRVLGTSDFLTTVMFYDDRGRVIQTQGDNHLGGEDITTTQYDFAGRVLHTYTKHSNPNSSANATTRILKRFAYDHAGRLTGIEQKLNDTGSLKSIVAHSYNDLGELATKELGDAGSPLETLDYKYNVRGWLKSINGDYVAGTGPSRFFGMDLSYDHGFLASQLNGNIAGVKWKTPSSDQVKAYGFEYDEVNRLTAADYSQGSGWSNASNDFSTTYGYDANGNILSLTREGMIAGTKVTLDDLTYGYGGNLGAAASGNQLIRVQDTEGDQGQGDFVDGNTTAVDYKYDANGNLIWDKNKGIYLSNDNTEAITYNHLNLPEIVSFGSSKTITYTYDAAGIKLRKLVNDNWNITVTDYVGGFIYTDNELQHFAHEEGRVRKNNAGNLVYDYFIKDHLGNTRMTLTEAADSTIYEATMETANLTFEQEVFQNIPNPASTAEAFEGTASAKLGPETIGPAKMLQVSAGDTVNLSVYAKYSNFSSTQSGGSGSLTSLGSAVASLFGATGGSASVYEQGTYNSLNTNAGDFLASAGQSGSSNVPLAYLNYVFFDQDFNYEESASGFVPVDAGANGVFDLVEKNDLVMPEGGYLYVYLSNEGRSSDGGDVYFDAFRVVHKQGNILQEDHYYPFGLSINALSSSAPLSKPNKYKYNGFEKQTEFDLGWYDYQARYYDPQLGRFMQVDPAADLMRRHSPYNYAFDNPIRFIDPDGMMPDDQTQDEYGQQQKAETAAINASHDNQFGFGSNGMSNVLDHSGMATHKQDNKKQDKNGKTEKPSPIIISPEGQRDQNPLEIVPVDLSQPGAYNKILRNLEIAFWKMRNEGTDFHLDDIVDLSTSFPNRLTKYLGPITGTSWGTASTKDYYFGDIQVRLYVNPMPEFAESEFNIIDKNGRKPMVLRYNKEGRSSLLYDVELEDPVVENGYYFIRALNWHEDGVVTFRTKNLDRALKIYRRLVSPQEYNERVKKYNKK